MGSQSSPARFDKMQLEASHGKLSKEELLQFSDKLATPEQLEKANEMLIFDQDGKTRHFRELYIGEEHYNQRQLIVFLRNIYCAACTNYVRCLTKNIPFSVYFSLPIPTTIIFITCGQPHLLAAYLKRTDCPFRIYTDPSRELYKIFDMPMTAKVGKKPEYTSGAGALRITADSWAEMGRTRPISDAFCGGNMFQIGGEFLFENGELIWCHRMPNMFGHSEMSTIRRILGFEELPVDDIDARSNEHSSSS